MLDERKIAFNRNRDLLFRGEIVLPQHPNGAELSALDAAGHVVSDQTYFSIGGGAIRRADEMGTAPASQLRSNAFAFRSAEELLAVGARERLSVAQVMLKCEEAYRPETETLTLVDRIWEVMNQSIERGLRTEGILPGGLQVRRRAPDLLKRLRDPALSNERETLFDCLNVFAIAVNEENAAGGRIVTAPTNGAAGIIPAVIKQYCVGHEGERERVRTFLLTAAAIGALYKTRASISGAEMGCQGEVGVASSMAAAGLAAIWGGDNAQIEHSAEIAMEHHLGLTCDPVGGLVQIPCIERNAFGAVKAVNAARLALSSTGEHKVSLDQVIETMRQTGLDMNSKYKETSRGGLAVNVVEC